MKSLRSLAAAASLAAILSVSAFAAETEPGYVDLGKLAPAAKGEFVEVNLSAGMFPVHKVLGALLMFTWIFMLVKASHEEMYSLPVIGELAQKSAAEH